MDYGEFDTAISGDKLRALDRAIAILWLAKSSFGIDGMSAKEIARVLEHDCGHPRQNTSRLHEQLSRDQRTAKHGKEAFRLRPNAFRVLDAEYGHHILAPKRPKLAPGGSVIPIEIFQQAGRTYLTRVVEQVNGCYEYAFFDGVMVLGRRLLETLVISVYQQSGRSADIKNASTASFLAFEDLAGKISADLAINITRETKKTLASLKKFGDQSAHNPHFTARQSDVDDIKHGLRIASEELLSLCHFKPLTD